MKIQYILKIGLVLLLMGCSASDEKDIQPTDGVLTLTSSVGSFVADGAGATRTNVAGTAFATGDRIKLKIICPYTDHTNFGETTYSNTADGFWLLKWNDSWTQMNVSDSIDVMAHYEYRPPYNLFDHFEAQQTPYVFTASTWTENVLFIAPNAAGGAARSYFSQYSYIFQANQSEKEDYLKSDLLWAQTYMQTGSYNVHLSFDHVMACLQINIAALGLSGNTVVTVENMPDIDQREVVVGDYYAARAKNLTQTGTNFDYSYRKKCSCDYENNGKVLGIAVINDATARADIYSISGNPVNAAPNAPAGTVGNTATYTAYRASSGVYNLIIPPCSLTTAPVIWIRDGEKRYSYTMTLDTESNKVTFEQGKLYPITIQAPLPTPTPDPEP